MGNILGNLLETMRPWDIVVLVIYFASMAAMGPLFMRRSRTTEGYFLGERSFPGWLVGFGLFATSISSITFVAYPADAFKTAWLRMLPNYMLPIGVIVASHLFLPFFRRGKITSAYEYLEGRFGPNVRLYAACAYIVMQIFRISMILFLVSVLVQEFTGLNPLVSVVVGGVITSFYTVLGGIRAVMWTDFIQAIVLWVGGLICIAVIVFSIPGGLGTIVSTAVEDGKFQHAEYKKWEDLERDFARGYTWEGTSIATVAETTENDGSYEWAIPASIQPGNDYMIRVSSPEGSIEDVSNVNFAIAAEPAPDAAHLLSPNWGEMWRSGTSEAIRWIPAFADTPSVKIDLHRKEEQVATLAENTPNNGTFQWQIPADLEAASDYYVTVSATSDPSAQAVSAAYFGIAEELKPGALTVASPNGSESWQPGSTHEIAWVSTADQAPSVKIEVIRGRGLHAVPKGLSLHNKTILMMLLVGLGNFWLLEYCANQNVVQRYCASRSTRDARQAMWICCFFSVPTWALFMFLGTCLYVFYKLNPNPETGSMMAGVLGKKPENVLPFFVLHKLPAGVSGLVIAAVLAAAMSSLSASMNGISAISIVDIYRRRFVKDRDDRHYLIVAKSITGVTAILMMIGAAVLVQAEGKTLQHTSNILASLCAGGLLGLYLLGFVTTTGDGRAAGVGIALTLLFTAWMAFTEFGILAAVGLGSLEAPIDTYYAGLLGHVLMFGVGYGLGKLLPRRKAVPTNLSVWTQDGSPLD